MGVGYKDDLLKLFYYDNKLRINFSSHLCIS